MIRAVSAAVLLLCAAAFARAEPGDFAAQSQALDAAVRSAASQVRPAAPAPAAVSPQGTFDQQVRAPLLARLRRNPVAARFAVPVLEQDPSIRFDIRDETGTDNWASYDHDDKVFTLYRNSANADLEKLNDKHRNDGWWIPVKPLELGQPLDPWQVAVICERYLPVIVHEVGGHARHYRDLHVILGKDGVNVYETELGALRLEAMAIAWERLSRPDYLDDGTDYGDEQRRLSDAFAKSFKKDDAGYFTDYLKKAFGDYDRLPAITPLSDDELRKLGTLGQRARVDCADLSSGACSDDLDDISRYLPERGRKELKTARENFKKEPKRTSYRYAVWDWIGRAEPRIGDSFKTLFLERDYFRKDAQLLDAAQKEFFSAGVPDYPDDPPDHGFLGGHRN